MFNCAVMGYNTSQHWMDLILEQLDNIAAKLHMEKSKAAYVFLFFCGQNHLDSCAGNEHCQHQSSPGRVQHFGA